MSLARSGLAGAAVALLAAYPAAIGSAPALAATALYMGGTFNELSVPEESPDFISYYIGTMDGLYVEPIGLCAGGDPGCLPLGVYTPEQLFPLTGLGDLDYDGSVAAGAANLDACLRGVPCIVTGPPYTDTMTRALTDTSYTVLGYSQSATIASEEKKALIAAPTDADISFVFVANPNRPNGGILERFVGAYFPVLGVSFSGATPTDSDPSAPLTTVDIARQYDFVADFPTNPLNPLALVNSLFGYYLIHLRPYDLGTPELQGQYQDSTYYLDPTETLPLLMPLAGIPLLGPLLAGVLDPALRVLVEAGFDRTINPGTPTPANIFYFPNPISTAVNLMVAVGTGLDNGIAYLTSDPVNRPLGTAVPGPYGVGGPPVYAGAIDPYGPPVPYDTGSTAAITAVTAEAVTGTKSSEAVGVSAVRTSEHADVADVGAENVGVDGVAGEDVADDSDAGPRRTGQRHRVVGVQPVAGGVAEHPLQVVGQRPGRVAADVHPVRDRLVDDRQVADDV